MSIFLGHDHLTLLQWLARGVIIYMFLVLMAKFMGQRSVSQLRFLDFVTALLLGGLLGNPLSDPRLDVWDGMISSSVLVTLHAGSALLSLKCERWRKFLEPPPLLLIQNGRFLLPNLKKARISMDYVLSSLRLQKIEDVQKVAVALWEPGGTISIFLKSEYETPTRNDMNIKSEPFALPIIVIKEGKIRTDALHALGKDETWLKQRIKEPIHTILFATLDEQNQLQFIFKE